MKNASAKDYASEKLLIINADDYGLSRPIVDACILAKRKGILNSVSIVSNTDDDLFSYSVRMAKQMNFDAGVHLRLCSCPLGKSRPITNLSKTFVDQQGHLKYGVAHLIAASLRDSKRKEIIRECEAQVKRVFDSGIRISHLDSHYYFSSAPALLRPMIKLCKKYQISYLRVPSQHIYLTGLFQRRVMNSLILKLMTVNQKQIIRSSGLQTSDYFFGILESGNLNKSVLAAILRKIKVGVTELNIHPSQKNTIFNERDQLEALISADIKSQIKKLGIKPVDFKDLA